MLSQGITSIFSSFSRSSANVSFIRNYARWTHRKPAKVLAPFEAAPTDLKREKVIDLSPKQLKKSDDTVNIIAENNKDEDIVSEDSTPLTSKKSEQNRFKEAKKIKVTKINKIKEAVSKMRVLDENNDPIYEKCNDSDGRINSLLVKLKSKKERLRSGMVLVEGLRLIVDGLLAKCQLRYIIFSNVKDLNKIKPFLPKVGVRMYKIPYKEIEMWSDVETPSGIFGVFETPTPDIMKRSSNPFPLQIICDNVRVPGNLGAILRASVGMGCKNVLLSKGCVDLWDPKVIRSAAGAHFRLPVYHNLDWDDICCQVPDDAAVFIADNNTTGQNDDDVQNDMISDIPVVPYYGVEYASYNSIALIVGGETEGISEDSYRFASSKKGLRLNIPLQHGVDSLNTGMATAVIAFEIKKQLLQAWAKIKQNKLLGQVG